jgi:hypothetical protein
MTFPPDLPGEITVQAGRSVTLELPSYAGGGYSWSIESPVGADIATVVLAPLDNAPAGPPPQELGVSEPPAMTLVPDQLTITGLSPGTTHCRLTLRRPFAPGPPAGQYDVQVTVLP